MTDFDLDLDDSPLLPDVPLSDVQLIWDCWSDADPDRPEVKVVSMSVGKDDNSYSSSWGACSSDFAEASPDEKLNMLFRQFHWMVVHDGVNANGLHAALVVIPEYRAAILPELLPLRYRQHIEYYG